MLLDHNATCGYGQSEERLLLLFHRFFVLGAVSLVILGAMYFVFMLLLNIIFLAKGLVTALYEMLSDVGPAVAGGLSAFARVMLDGLAEVWSVCTRDNMQYLFSLAIVYHFMPMIVEFCEQHLRDIKAYTGGNIYGRPGF
jgi:hypothetical protein